MKASPSFQFYPDRWLGGTSHLSPAARGIYLDLLCWQWNHVKPLPLSVSTRTQIGRCTLEQFTSAWVEISDKFHETTDGFRNEALERGRSAGMTFMDAQREKAKKGAAARWAKATNSDAPGIAGALPECVVDTESIPPVANVTTVDSTQNASKTDKPMPGASLGHSPGHSRGNAPVMPSISISISNSDLDLDLGSADPATSKIENTRAVVPRARKAGESNNHAKPTNLINGVEARRHGSHAWCSTVAGRAGMCVPQFLHEEFTGKGNKADAALRAWYAGEIVALQGAAVGDELRWWRSRFTAWIGNAPGASRAATVPDAESTQAYIRGVQS